jgi:predicted phage tail protein
MKLADAARAAKLVNAENARKFAQHVVPEVARPARVIWNQAVGAVFLLFAISFAGYAITQAQNPAALAGGIFLCAVMGFFGVSSFVKARRISRR